MMKLHLRETAWDPLIQRRAGIKLYYHVRDETHNVTYLFFPNKQEVVPVMRVPVTDQGEMLYKILRHSYDIYLITFTYL